MARVSSRSISQAQVPPQGASPRFRITSFRESHLEELFAIEAQSFGEDSYRGEFFSRLCMDNRDLLLVAIAGTRPLGYVMGEWQNGGAEVISLAVRPECRELGIGRKLLQRLLLRIQRSDASRVTLMVRADNRPAINLYRSMGFQRIRRVPAYYMDGQDAIRMRLDFAVNPTASALRS